MYGDSAVKKSHIIISGLSIIGMFALLLIPAYADEVISSQHRNQQLHFDNIKAVPVGTPDGVIFGNNIVQSFSDFYAVDYEKSKSFINDLWQAHTLVTSGSITIDESVDLKGKSKNQYNIAKPVSILTEDRYNEWRNPVTIQAKDEGGAPHRSGLGTWDNDKFYFGNVVEQPVFVHSNTELFYLNLKATDRYVPVYYNGIKLPGYIDVGVQPEEGKWLSPGNKPFPLPFDVYYGKTSEGHLLHFGEGYQHVFRDLGSMTVQNEKEEGLTHYEPLRPEHSYGKQMQLAFYLRN